MRRPRTHAIKQQTMIGRAHTRIKQEEVNQMSWHLAIYFNIMQCYSRYGVSLFLARWHYLSWWGQFGEIFSHATATQSSKTTRSAPWKCHRAKDKTAMENEFEFYCSIVAQLCLCRMSFARGPLCDKFNAKNYYTLNYRHFIRLFFSLAFIFWACASVYICELNVNLLLRRRVSIVLYFGGKWSVIKWISI